MNQFDRSTYHLPQRHPTGRFPKRDRLLHVGEFRRVYRRGFHASTPRFGCYVLPSRRPRSRLGISVSRKFGNSPLRNGIKRRLREIFRQMREKLPCTIDLVVVPRRGAHDTPLGGIAEDLDRLVRQALRERKRRKR